MKTKIATTFGLALMLGLGIFVTMLALGLFNTAPSVHASQTTAATIVVVPVKARDTAQYTISVSATTSLAVGQRIFVTFPSGTGVPSSIATANVKIKALLISDPKGGINFGTGLQQQDAAAITVSGREVAITIPDMNTGTNTGGAPENAGDNGIRTGSEVTITFLQAAGIQNPNLAKLVGVGYKLNVRTDTDTTEKASNAYAISSSITLSSSSKPRGEVITVSGVGLNPNCTVCNIRFTSSSTIHGSGTIDANGVFTGTFNVDSGTSTDGGTTIEVTDAKGIVFTSAASFTNKAGAIPRVTSAFPGANVKVDLFDFTKTVTASITTLSKIGIIALTNLNITGTGKTSTSTTGNFIIDEAASGNSPALFPYQFTLPNAAGIPLGTYIVSIADNGPSIKSATFTLEIVSGTKTLTVTPNPAAIGQTITIEGSGFSKTNGFIQKGDLKAAGFSINPNDVITVDSVGSWSFVTRLSTNGENSTGPAGQVSDAITIVATEKNAATSGGTTGIVGKSSGFKRTERKVTAAEAAAAPGAAVTLSGTGMTVDTNQNLSGKEISTTASVTITLSTGTLTGNVFPVSSDGSWFGIITLPLDAAAATLTITATDSDGAATDASFELVVNNVAPSVSADNVLVTVNESETANNAGTYSDLGDDIVTITASTGNVSQDDLTGTWSWTFDTNDGPDQTQTVTITATDSDGAATDTTFELVVNNVAPSVSADNASVTVNESETAANTGTYSDLAMTSSPSAPPPETSAKTI